MKPTIEDFLMKAERHTQVVYPKDLGLIAVKTGVSSGSIVVEAGTGSGVLTGLLANLVRPDGHVYSFDNRPEFLKVARKSLEKIGLLQYVTLTEKDAKEGLEVKDADVGIIDVGDPWSLVKPFSECLAPSAVLAAVSPTMNQVEKLVAELSLQGFVDVESVELILRGLEARPNMTRPSMMMIGHTAYLTFARKTVLENK
ncbi:MAG: methyltransferase domain-containing protein [Thaumarchaeota archaeon]|nr:methyltransferase domain-containing protein [Nitrososphaerota archaeon]